MRVLLVGSYAFLDHCQEVMQQEPNFQIIGRTTQLREARDYAMELEPDLMLVEDAMHLDIVARLVRSVPRTAVILASEEPTLDLQRRAARLGIVQVIQYPIDLAELSDAVDHLYSLTQRRVAPEPEYIDEDEELGFDLDSAVPASVAALRQEVIVIHSSKGGVGKTTVALNLAAQFRQTYGPKTRVLLVDLDPFGNLVGYLDMEGYATVEHWAKIEHEPSAKEIETELTRFHPPTGIHIIPSPRMVSAIESMDTHAIDKILLYCRRYFDIIIIDLCPLLLDAQVRAMEHATRIYEVVVLEIPTLRSLHDFRGFMDRLVEINQANVGLILNRVPEVLPRQFGSWRRLQEEFLPPHWPIVAKLPESPEVTDAVNEGGIAVLQYPDSAFAAGIRKLVGSPAEASEPKLKSKLFKFLGR